MGVCVRQREEEQEKRRVKETKEEGGRQEGERAGRKGRRKRRMRWWGEREEEEAGSCLEILLPLHSPVPQLSHQQNGNHAMKFTVSSTPSTLYSAKVSSSLFPTLWARLPPTSQTVPSSSASQVLGSTVCAPPGSCLFLAHRWHRPLFA